jgi:glycosyltransferase involved in cell wall biosynthesis
VNGAISRSSGVTALDPDPTGESMSDVLFLAWGAISGRSAELSSSVGASSVCLYPPGSSRRPRTSVRYLLSAFQTVRILQRQRPNVVVVTNPPLLLPLLVMTWSSIVGDAKVVLDSHPGAFGAMGDRMGAALLPVHRWVAKRVAFSLVASPFWQDKVEAWGGSAMVVHEARGAALTPPLGHEPLRVLYVGTFAQDEPVEAIVGAARVVPECALVVTGDLAQAPAGLYEAASQNVRFAGFLDTDDYVRQLEESDLVVALTTEPNSVMRAAYEAVYANRPLIISNWPILKELFPDAIHADNDEKALALALRRAIRDHPDLMEQTGASRARQIARWNLQRTELIGRLQAARASNRHRRRHRQPPVS